LISYGAFENKARAVAKKLSARKDDDTTDYKADDSTIVTGWMICRIPSVQDRSLQPAAATERHELILANTGRIYLYTERSGGSGAAQVIEEIPPHKVAETTRQSLTAIYVQIDSM
jgi:hypothetical protein